jgi:chorismate mutase
LQNRFPDLPLLIDPHITGDREMILEVTQEALDLNYDGMIIETHYDPDNAWRCCTASNTNCIETNFVDLKVRKVDDMSTEFTQNEET